MPEASLKDLQPAAYSDTSRHQFLQLDGLRGLSAFFILAIHTAAISGMLTNTHSALREFMPRLDVGVTIFFLLSGFLIYRPFAKANLADKNAPNTVRYLSRRALRIVPAYWVALTIVTIWLNFEATVFTASGIPLFYGFLQVYDPANVVQGIAQAWTLCIEVSFYLFIPLFALGVQTLTRCAKTRLRGEICGLALLFLVAITAKAALLIVLPVNELQTASVAVTTLPWYLATFAIGMTLATISLRIATQSQTNVGRIPARYVPLLCWILGAVALIFVSKGIGLAGFLGETSSKSQIVLHDLFNLLAGTLFLLPSIFIATNLSRIGKSFASKPAVWLGRVSYSFYLYHLAWLAQLDSWGFGDVAEKTPFPYLVWLAAGFAGTAVISTCSFYLIERPFLKLRPA